MPAPAPPRIRDLMARNPRTAPASASIVDVFELMVEGGFRHVPIVEGGRAIGIVSDRDVLKNMPPPSTNPAQLGQHAAFATRPAREIMSRDPICLSEDEPLETAVELMIVNQVSSVLALDGAGALTGVVTLVDVARAALALLRAG